MDYVIYFDGSCYPTSPGGTAVSGFVITQNGVTVESFSGIIGQGATTSLMAEYRAVVEGLRAFYTRWATIGAESLTIHGDSKVVINQLCGKFAKPPKYLKEYNLARAHMRRISDAGIPVKLEWASRERNLADKVCKRFRSLP